jgi:tRNA-2-methylthio-N6-dimethylallyladenosine synthase
LRFSVAEAWWYIGAWGVVKKTAEGIASFAVLIFRERDYVFQHKRIDGDKMNAYVRTYGCQQNVADSEKIKGVLENLGFGFTDDVNFADLVIFNTCAVRKHAQDRVLGNIGILKNIKLKRPSMKIIVCGCMSEQDGVADCIKSGYRFVDVVLGTDYLKKLPEIIRNLFSVGWRVSENCRVENIPAVRESKIKAWVPIMQGCDNFCSYCVVPYVRGREKSRDVDCILDEIKTLVAGGYKEITLLGQNVNSYGKGLKNDINFPRLLEKLDSIEGNYRLRFMTSHPKDATFELIDVMAQSRHICRHLHLPVQSGSDKVLALMNRKYTRKDYMKVVDYGKKLMPDLHFTSDVIVGFPGEKYSDFKKTLSIVRETRFLALFTFIYSPRPGTVAASMPDIVSYEEKSKWFSELLEIQGEISNEIYAGMLGKEYEILIESKIRDGLYFGRTSSNAGVEVESFEKNLTGKFATVKITCYNRTKLRGVVQKWEKDKNGNY